MLGSSCVPQDLLLGGSFLLLRVYESENISGNYNLMGSVWNGSGFSGMNFSNAGLLGPTD